jgi:hypothetical protein
MVFLLHKNTISTHIWLYSYFWWWKTSGAGISAITGNISANRDTTWNPVNNLYSEKDTSPPHWPDQEGKQTNSSSHHPTRYRD